MSAPDWFLPGPRTIAVAEELSRVHGPGRANLMLSMFVIRWNTAHLLQHAHCQEPEALEQVQKDTMQALGIFGSFIVDKMPDIGLTQINKDVSKLLEAAKLDQQFEDEEDLASVPGGVVGHA